MNANFMDLNKILNIQKWQTLQDSLARVTNMAIITVDYKGIPITTHSYPCRFCQYVRSRPDLRQFCFKCDSRGGLEAVRLNAPYIYLCHCNIVDLAVPIMVDGKYIGAIMMGEIRLSHDEEDYLEKILISPSKKLLDDDDILKLYKEIPTVSYDYVQKISNLVFDLSNYIVEEAISNNVIGSIKENILGTSRLNYEADAAAGFPYDDMRLLRRAYSKAITDAYTKNQEKLTCKNPVLRPAFDYIYNNKNGDIALKQMADICHISASHFSRIFANEVGENFSSFLSRLKIQWSKQLLEKTDLPIAQICDQFGFSDPSYYIRVFKKFENVTPAVYRKYALDSKAKEQPLMQL